MMKKVTSLLLVMVMCFALYSPASAQEINEVKYVNEWEVEVAPAPDNSNCIIPTENSEEGDITINGGDADLWRWRKTNVSIVFGWTPYYRISDNMKTDDGSGTITSTKSVSISASITGSIFGIDVDTGATVSNEIGYAMEVLPHKQVYMGYRVKTKTETGTREMYNCITGQTVQSNNYTVVAPLYGEYALINY